MSVNYADALSPYPNKGKVGMKEFNDDHDKIRRETDRLAELIRESKHTIAIVGAGISTSVGIPDFRGPNGVWTLEKQGKKPENVIGDFMSARPSQTHRALVALQRANMLQFVVSQNIDGLLHRSGFPMDRLAEVHGNVFIEKCPQCRSLYIRQQSIVPTMTLKPTGRPCERLKLSSTGAGASQRSIACRGILRDTILDWEDELPEPELSLSMLHSKSATLCLCLGTSLQIFPVAGLPGTTKRNKGQVAIVNLQKTRCDQLADCRIFAPVDHVMTLLCEKLNVNIDANGVSKICLKSDSSSQLPLLEHDFMLNSQF